MFEGEFFCDVTHFLRKKLHTRYGVHGREKKIGEQIWAAQAKVGKAIKNYDFFFKDPWSKVSKSWYCEAPFWMGWELRDCWQDLSSNFWVKEEERAQKRSHLIHKYEFIWITKTRFRRNLYMPSFEYDIGKNRATEQSHPIWGNIFTILLHFAGQEYDYPVLAFKTEPQIFKFCIWANCDIILEWFSNKLQ